MFCYNNVLGGLLSHSHKIILLLWLDTLLAGFLHSELDFVLDFVGDYLGDFVGYYVGDVVRDFVENFMLDFVLEFVLDSELDFVEDLVVNWWSDTEDCEGSHHKVTSTRSVLERWWWWISLSC